MKYVFLWIFFFLLGMSAIAWRLTPAATPDSSKVIVWSSDDNPSRREQIVMFNRLHPQYSLQLDSTNTGMGKVVTQSLAGVGPDVFDASTDQLALLSDAGLLYDVTDQLKSRGITLDQIWPLGKQSIAINGRMFGMPCNVNCDAVWFHKDIFDQEHIPYPPVSGWKWDDFVSVAQKLTQRDARGHIQRFGVNGLTYIDAILTAGGRLLTPDGRKCIVDSPECIDAVQKWLDLQLKYNVAPTPEDESSLSTQGGWGTGTISLFREKRVAMAIGGRWWLSNLRLMKDAAGNFPFQLGLVEKPVIRFRRFVGGPRVAYVNKLSKNRDSAVEFLAYLGSDEYSDAINTQADSLPGIIKKSDRPAYDYDPYHGQDCGNSPLWKTLSQFGIRGELSPYIATSELTDTLTRQIDQIRTGRKSVAAGLHEGADRVNQIIRMTVERDPQLKAKFDDGDTSPSFGNFVDPPEPPLSDPGANGGMAK